LSQFFFIARRKESTVSNMKNIRNSEPEEKTAERSKSQLLTELAVSAYITPCMQMTYCIACSSKGLELGLGLGLG